MATTSDSSNSILGALAEHEASLTGKIDSAAAEAKDTVDRARRELLTYAKSEDAKLAEEVSKLRAQAEAAREARFSEALRAAEEELEGGRADAAQRVPEATQQVTALFFPRAGGGSA